MSKFEKTFAGGNPLKADELNQMVAAINDNDDRIDSLSEETNKKLTELKSIVEKTITGNVTLVNGYYILNREKVITTIQESSSFKCARCLAKEGQQFYVQGVGYSASRVYAFAADDMTILEVAEDGADTTQTPRLITAPIGTKWLFFNVNTNSAQKYGVWIVSDINSLLTPINENIDGVKISYISTQGVRDLRGAYIPLYPENSTEVLTALYRGKSGDVFKIHGRGASAARLWATADENMNIIRVADANAAYWDGIEIILSDSEKFIAVNSIITEGKTPYVELNNSDIKNITTRISNIDESLSGCEHEISDLPNKQKDSDKIGNYYPNVIEVYPAQFENGYIDSGGVAIIPSESLKHSPFIEVLPLSEVSIFNFCNASFSYAHFYNKDYEWIGKSKSNTTGSSVDVKNVVIPSNAKYIRYSILTTQVSNNYVRYTNLHKNYFAEALYKKWLDSTSLPIDNLFKTLSQSPIVTIIDDDTQNIEHVSKFKSICDENNIKGTYACLTQNFASVPTLAKTLKAYEREGFQTILHGYSQHSAYRNPEDENNKAICEDDIVHGLQDLEENGFTDYKFWAVPFGVDKPELRSLARKWGLECNALVTGASSGGYEGTNNIIGRYQLRRTGLNATDDAGSVSLDKLKSFVDAAARVGGWVLVCTHMYDWGEDMSRFTDFVNHAKSKGCKFMTLGEAWRLRKRVYELNELFNANL